MDVFAVSYDDVWQRAKKLPVNAQMELAEALLHNVRLRLDQEVAVSNESNLVPLRGLSASELQALAAAVVSTERQKSLNQLLDKNHDHTLSEEEAAELDRLVDEIDQVALLKARALYTLKLNNSIDMP